MTNEIMNDSDKHCINDPYMFLQLSYNYNMILLIINLGEKPSWLANRGEVV